MFADVVVLKYDIRKTLNLVILLVLFEDFFDSAIVYNRTEI